MKNTSHRLPLAAFVLAATLAACFAHFGPAGAARVREGSAQQASLRGQAAADYLRQSGLSDALAASAASEAFAEQAKLLASDGAAQDNFGFSVAVSGDTAVVGAPRDQVGANTAQGSAYVYVRNGSAWTQQQKLTASDGTTGDEFGYAVAVTGDTIFVGRHNTVTGANRSRGVVYVYTRSGSTWAQGPSLLSDDGAEGDNFGVSLAADGGTLVVGAQLKTNGANFFQGAAYVFTGAGAAWTQQAKLLADDGGFATFFGTSVAVSGDTAVVGAPGQPGTSADQGRGSAYVFTRAGSAWTKQQKLLASDGAAGDAFGFSVGVSGDTAVVGARLDTVNGVGAQGSAYVFTRTGTTWAEQQHLFGVEQVQRNDQFGYAVAVRGDRVAVGSPLHEVVGNIANHGAVYVFTRSGNAWARTQKLIHSDPNPDALGQALALDATSVVAGAPTKNSNRGAAYVFKLFADAQPKLVGSELFSGIGFGRRVAISNDTALTSSLNFGTNLFRRVGSQWEFVRKVQGSATGTDSAPMSGGVAIEGDLMVVGSMASRANNVVSGAAFVFVRSGGDWVEQARLLPSDATFGQNFGSEVAISGETVVVGAPNTVVDGKSEQGAVYVFTRTGSTWTQQQKLTFANGAAQDFFGQAVAVSGDTLLVGAPMRDVGDQENQGSAYVFTRTGSTWTLQKTLLASDGNVSDGFGRAVALEGGTAVVGAPVANFSNRKWGTAYVFTGAGATWTQQQQFLPPGEDNTDFATSVAIEGSTIVVGAPRADGPRPELDIIGAVYVYKLNGATWQPAGRLIAFDNEISDDLGLSVDIAGNLIIAGAPGDDMFGRIEVGSAYVFDLNDLNPDPTPTPTPTPTATPTPTPSPTPSAPGVVQFTSPTFDGEEGAGSTAGVSFGEAPSWQAAGAAAAGSVTMTVTRTEAAAAASVDYETQDGTASARSDYTAVFGTLRFAAGETSKTIVIPVTDDRFKEEQESFTVVLSNPVGVSLGTPSAAAARLTSDDAADGPSPVGEASFDVEFFVRQHYRDFFSREPDAAGLAFWTNVASGCGNPDVLVCRINVSGAFFLSIEFQQTGYLVERMYKSAYGDAAGTSTLNGTHQLTVPVIRFEEFLRDTQRVGRGVIVNQGDWENQLEANKAAFAQEFVQRARFLAAFPVSLTPTQFVDQLNLRAGNPLDAAERQALIDELAANNTTAGRASVLRKVAEDKTLFDAELNRAFVLMQYFGYLRRDPNSGPDTDYTGYDFWLGNLERFNGNFVQAELVKAFISSDEYRKRFGQ